MARTTSKAANATATITGVGQQQEPLEITRQNIYDAALWTARHTNRIPTLIGPTASGKTWGVHQIAETINAEVVTVLLGQHTPDEVAGFQLALNNELVAQMPYWFKAAQTILDNGKSVIILFDELGLSREETRGALYTFFRDRHLHGHHLNSRGNEVLVFAASNPAVFAPPFRSRCLFFPVPADRSYLMGMASGPTARRILKDAPISHDEDPFYSNDPPPPPLVVDASAAAVLNAIDDSKTGFWRLDRGAYISILMALLPTQTLAEFLRDRPLDASSLAQDYDVLGKALRALPRDNRHSMINDVLVSMGSLTPETRALAIACVQDVLYDDVTTEDLLIYFQTQRPDDVIRAVSEIDADHMVEVLKDKDLLYVNTDKQGNHKVGGSIAVRVQAMVDYTNKNQS